MRNALLATVFALSALAGGCEPRQEADNTSALDLPELETTLRASGADRISIEVANADPRYAACFLPPATGDVMWADNPVAYFRAVDASGRVIEQVGPVFTGSGPALRSQVVFVRPGASLTSALNVEEYFPGALTPGSCIAFQIPFYANCRAIEDWDITSPMRPDTIYSGAGSSRSDWRVSDAGELLRLPSGQACQVSF